MAVNLTRINNELFKLAKGFGYTIEMYDENGNGPIASPSLAAFIFLKPDNIMISLPTGYSSQYDEVFVYRGKGHDKDKFRRLLQRIRVVCRLNGLGVTPRDFANREIKPSDFAFRARAKREEENQSE